MAILNLSRPQSLLRTCRVPITSTNLLNRTQLRWASDKKEKPGKSFMGSVRDNTHERVQREKKQIQQYAALQAQNRKSGNTGYLAISQYPARLLEESMLMQYSCCAIFVVRLLAGLTKTSPSIGFVDPTHQRGMATYTSSG